MEQQTSNQYSKKWNILEKAEKPDRSNKKKGDPVILVQMENQMQFKANDGKIAISVYDAQNLEGYQIKGTAEYVTEGTIPGAENKKEI